jgi:DNA-directed RNA polymerase specialized sigma24 family protein
MITAKTRLIEAATALRRTIYRALPWGLRLGGLLFNLRYAADARSFGQLSYGLFHLYGVNGLPGTPFVPETLREIDRLPDGYGAEFGQKARRIAQKYVSDADQVDEILSLAALKLMSSSTFERSVRGKNLHEAENYVLRLVQNQALDMLRSEKVRRHDDITELLREPGSWEGLSELIPEREQAAIKLELEQAVSPRLMPDLPLYFDLLLDGHSNKEIAERRLLPSLESHPISQQAMAKYRDKLKSVLRKHFEVQAAA